MRVSALALVALLFPAVASAAGFEAIILGGGKSVADAEKAVAEYGRRRVSKLIHPAAGYPKVIDSATVPGLNKGFQIAVLGFCPDDGDGAEMARDLLNFEGRGVYVKGVKGAYPKACPKLTGDRAAAPADFKLKASNPAGTAFPTMEWRVYARDLPRLDPGETWKDTVLVMQLVQDGRLIEEEDLDGEERVGDGEGDYGSSEDAKFREFVELGGRTLLWVVEGSYGGDTGSLQHSLHGFACGKVSRLIELGGQTDPCCGPPESYEVQPQEKGGLRLVHSGLRIEKEEVEALSFDEDACRVVSRPVESDR